MPALEDFRRSKGFAVCVDSDGCAMDTMNIKHIRCFGPCMVEEWGLEAWREADVVVVSSANPEAVRDEWARFELLPHVDLLCTQEMGKPEGLNADEVEGLKSRSAVEPEEWPFDWKDGELTLRAELGVNDVYGFVIR